MMSKHRFESETGYNENPIDLTPLIDVVFVVLITFMVIAPLLSLESINLSQSGSPQKKELSAPDVPVTIKLFEGGQVKINDQAVSISGLEACLKGLKQKHPETTPLLLSDKKAHFGAYIKVKGALEKVGFEKLHIAVEDEHSS